MSDKDILIGLNIAGIGYIRLKRLIEVFGGLEEISRGDEFTLRKIDGMGPDLAGKILSLKDGSALEKERKLIDKERAGILTVFDEGYPENLKNIYDPPIVLYVKGEIKPEDKRAVALVGSRRASLYGLNICRDLAGALSARGITVISGLARGIDSAAHKGTLDAGGRTVAVLGSGLNNLYPPENRAIAGRIADSGALISEFPMGMAPLKRNFPIRNRVISGLSLGVVVVEAAKKSGALITAYSALEEGREVFAVPGKAGTVTAMGTHGLIKKGAKLVDGIDDIIEELNLSTSDLVVGPSPPAKGMNLEGTEKRLYDILSEKAEHIDTIVDKTRLPAQEIAGILLKMEFKRLVKELPGKNYITIG